MKDKNQQPKHHPENLKKLIDSVLDGQGHSQSTLRHAVAERSAAHAGRLPQLEDRLPAELETYVDKVALHAYKVTDADIENLRNAGYSEDEIFELTVSAALGAGIARFERAMALLKGEK